MQTNTLKPSERADQENNWQLDPSQFEEGPDNWNQETREGWRLYLVEDVPTKEAYALCKYSWKNNRELTIVDIGTISIEAMITQESVNEALRKNDVDELSDSQYDVINRAYKECLYETIRNTILEKGFQICDHTVYYQLDDWTDYLKKKIQNINEDIEKIKQMVADNNVPEHVDDLKVTIYRNLEPISDEHMENLDVLEEAVERPHEDGLQFAQFCPFVGKIKFTALEPYQMRAIELVHNGVFYNNEAVAIVQSLREEGYTQKEIAEKLDKDESTISKQVSVAKNLTKRSRWHSANVTLDGRH